MPRSLRGRLVAIVALLVAAALAAGLVMLALFQQSTDAQIGQSEALVGRACDAIARTYRFYVTDWTGGEPRLDDPALRQGLGAVVVTALRDKPGIEGGLWQATAGSLAYGFPTYEGGPKNDVPQAELGRIRAVNQAALTDDRASLSRTDSAAQTLLITACPLPGPIPSLTAWAMTRVHSFGGSTYHQLMAGLAILFLAVCGATLLAVTLVLNWSRHVGGIEAALGAHDAGDLPVLARTGERELDRIVSSLNEAGQRLTASRARAEQLSRQVAAGERLAAIGRVAAGVAHEIRNPIAAMRLKAESALGGPPERKEQALRVVIAQVDRLDGLVRSLLTVSERDAPQTDAVALAPFLAGCADLHRERAEARGIVLSTRTGVATARFDAAAMERALGNLVLNALQVEGVSQIRLAASRTTDRLVLAVADDGPGPPPALRDTLFEPFVTGRPDGTGLGLSIVREIAEAHGGTARCVVAEGGTTFSIEVPWLAS